MALTEYIQTSLIKLLVPVTAVRVPPSYNYQLKPCRYLTIILRNRAEYHLILSRRGRRPSWLNQGIFRKIEQDNCFIIQQVLIDYHFQNEKNYGSMTKTLKASNT